MSRQRDQRGLAISVEAAVVLPALLLFVGLLLTLARLALADQHVGSAAAAAARAASLERSAPAAELAGRAAATETLARRNVDCLASEVDAQTSAFAAASGGSVTVRVVCSVRLSDLTLPFIPGSIDVTASRTSPVDPLRGK